MNDDTQTLATPVAASDSELTRYSWADYDRPSAGVVEAVAAVTDRGVTDLPQLGRAIDPDALNNLVGGTSPGDSTDVHVTFSYAGVTVSIDSTGSIQVTE